MNVTVSTRDYQFSHNRAPRGYGSWAFAFDGAEQMHEIFWVHSATYTQARKAAVAEARRRGARDVEVMS